MREFVNLDWEGVVKILEKLRKYRKRNYEEYLTDMLIQQASEGKELLEKEAAENAQEPV